MIHLLRHGDLLIHVELIVEVNSLIHVNLLIHDILTYPCELTYPLELTYPCGTLFTHDEFCLTKWTQESALVTSVSELKFLPSCTKLTLGR